MPNLYAKKKFLYAVFDNNGTCEKRKSSKLNSFSALVAIIIFLHVLCYRLREL